MTRSGGKPVAFAIKCVISSSGLVTTTTTAFGACCRMPSANGRDDRRIHAGKIRPAHAGLARTPRRDDDIIRARDSGEVGASLDAGGEAAQRGAVPHVERQARRKAGNDVGQDDAREGRGLGQPQSRHRADMASADDRCRGPGIGGTRRAPGVRSQARRHGRAAPIERAGERLRRLGRRGRLWLGGSGGRRSRRRGNRREALRRRQRLWQTSRPARSGRRVLSPGRRRAA